MNMHVHFDVSGYRQAAQALNDRRTAEAIAANPDRADFIKLQQHFYELVIVGGELTMEATNQGTNQRDIADALGIAIGTLMATAVISMGRNYSSVAVLSQRLASTANAILDGDPRVTDGGSYRPMQGGHA